MVEAKPRVVLPVTFNVPSVAILPVKPVVVAMPLTIKLPETETRVVDALTRVVRPVRPVVPVTVNVPSVAMLPLEPVVVAMPLTIKLPETETLVVVALTKVVSPVKPVVPVTVRLPSVEILSPIVVAPKTKAATKKTEIKTAIK